MDDDHQHTVPHHRNTGVEALDTMRVKRVTMSIIHTKKADKANMNALFSNG